MEKGREGKGRGHARLSRAYACVRGQVGRLHGHTIGATARDVSLTCSLLQ